MARVALYKHATYVDPTTYPDDGTSPVGTTEWNLDPAPAGMLGFTPTNATITTSGNPSGTVTPTDSICVVAAHTGTTGVITKLVNTNTNAYDLLYLFADAGDTITLTNTASPSNAGEVKTISGENETLSETKPTILIRKGNFWYGYGGGTTADGSVTNAKLADMAANTVKVRDANSTGSPTDKAVADTQILIGDGTGFTAASLSGQATMANTGAVTIATLNQNTTGSSATCTGLAATATALATARTIGGTSFDGTQNIAVALSATATALATGRTIASTGDITWTTGSFTGAGNATGVAAITADVIVNADVKTDAAIAYSKLATLADGNILVGNGSGVPTSVMPPFIETGPDVLTPPTLPGGAPISGPHGD